MRKLIGLSALMGMLAVMIAIQVTAQSQSSFSVPGGSTLPSTTTGSGSVVLASSPTIATPTLTGTVTFGGGSGHFSATANADFNAVTNTGCQANYYQTGLSCGPAAPIGWGGTLGSSTINTAFSWLAAGVAALGTGAVGSTAGSLELTNVRTVAVAVSALPTCNSGAEGKRASVTDSNAVSFTAGIGAVVAAGGSTHVPVVCDGTNWRIG